LIRPLRLFNIVLMAVHLISCGAGSPESEVEAARTPPTVTSPTALDVESISDWTFQLEAVDAEGDNLSWRLAGSADVAVFSLTSEGLLSFADEAAETLNKINSAQTLTVIVAVSDGIYETEVTLAITIMPPLLPGTVELEERFVTLTASGEERVRSYWLASSEPAGDGMLPVVFFFHGAYGDYRLFLEDDEVKGLIAKGDFIGVFLSSNGDLWELEGSDVESDIAFVQAVLSDLREVDLANLFQVFAIGFSNGGVMASTVAQELSYFSGIATINGHLRETQLQRSLSQPLTVIQITGALDTTIPADGGVGFDGERYASAEVSAEYWATQMFCNEEKPSLGVRWGDYTVNDRVFSECQSDHRVVSRTIEDVGHVRRLEGDAQLITFIWSMLRKQ
jgi:poly(3-hydroxybutyrate) depolymerase